MFMSHFLVQVEAEFTPKLLRVDLPSYEYLSPDKYQFYKQVLDVYSEQLDLNFMVTSFRNYMKKMMTHVLPSSNARYVLMKLLIVEGK